MKARFAAALAATLALIAGFAWSGASTAAGIRPAVARAYAAAADQVHAERPSCGLDAALLAGIGGVGSSHVTHGNARVLPGGDVRPKVIGMALNGTNGTAVIPDTDSGALDADPVWDRAVGPMQFIPSTWATYAAAWDLDGNSDGIEDPHNLRDALTGTGHYLCTAAADAGSTLRSPTGRWAAVFAYNHADWYVARVLREAFRVAVLAAAAAA